jgi:hypothetical protein
MEKRQRILIIIIGALVVFGMISKGKPWLIDPLTKIDRDIAEAKAKLDEKCLNIERKDDLRDRYLKLAKKTLSTDAEQAGKELRAILAELAKSVGLPKAQIDPPIPRRNIRDRLHGGRIAVVRSGVKGPGTVKQWVDFLEAFYKLPYAVQIAQITFSQHMINRKGKISVTLNGDVDVEAIVLPASDFVPQAMVKTADLSPKGRKVAASRLERDAASLRNIYKKDIFTPVLALKPPPTTKPTDNRVANKSTQSRFKKRKGTTLVVGVTRWPWTDPKSRKEHLIQEVMTRNDLTKEKLIVRIGERLDDITDAKLVYVDSTGAVARTSDQKLWFYPLGKPLKEHVAFNDPEIAPEAWWAVQQLGYMSKGKK